MATRMVRHVVAASFIVLGAPAQADGWRNTACLRTAGAAMCTTQWRHIAGASSQYLPWHVDLRETAASAERERRWLARCRPVAKEDSLGVSRYQYAAAGCEFGKTED
jgi:hypothetical protein